MNELDKSIEQILENQVIDRHSFFQLQFFVIGKEPTLQSKLWRCVKELQARKESLDSLNLEIEDVKDKIILLELEQLENSFTQIDGVELSEITKKKKEIKVRSCERHAKSLRKTINTLEKKKKHVEEEASFFVSAYKELSKFEAIKSYDDENSQLEYWNEKLSQELGLRGLIRQPLDIDLVKTILAMDDKAPIKKKTTEMLERAQNQIVESQFRKIAEAK